MLRGIIGAVNTCFGNRAFSLLKPLAAAALATALAICAGTTLTGCGASEGTSGASFTPATSITESAFHESEAEGSNGALVDTSAVSSGYVAVKATNSSRLKLQVSSGGQSANFDIPNNGQEAICPLTFGSGTYQFRVMQNTSGSNYVELYSTTANVELNSEFAPYLCPNIYCDFSEGSACVSKARELVANAQNQGDAVEAICNYVVQNVTYDEAKAAQLKETSGYVPNPDSTLSSGTGICFDYASLGAAMLRSQGIPAKIVTGYVSPDSIYHAWIMVYIDGTWKSAQFSVNKNEWSRVDLTFAASGSTSNVGDGKTYTDRYTY